MSTLRQKLAAKKTAEALESGGALPMKKILENAGYKRGTALNPQQVSRSIGFLKEMERLGFDEASARKVIAEILNTGSNSEKLKATEQIFRVLGSYAPEKSINVQTRVPFDNPRITAIRDEYERKLRESLMQDSLASLGED